MTNGNIKPVRIKLSGQIELFGKTLGPNFLFRTEESAREFCKNLGINFDAVVQK